MASSECRRLTEQSTVQPCSHPHLESPGLLQCKLLAVTQDLLQCRGPEWHTGLDSEPGPTVKELLTELYMRVGDTRQWALIRYISGILKKKVEALDEVTTMHLASSGLRSVGEEAAEQAGKLQLHLLCLALPWAEAQALSCWWCPG